MFDNPKLTGKAITVVVIGLACGMGSWVMAIFVTVFSWLLIFWLDSVTACEFRIRLANEADPKRTPAVLFSNVQSFLVSRSCRVQGSPLYKGKKQVTFQLHIPAGLDLRQLELDVRAMLPEGDDARIDIDAI